MVHSSLAANDPSLKVFCKQTSMRSTIAKKILDETPAEVMIFVRKYGDIVVRVHQLLRQKGWMPIRTKEDSGDSIDGSGLDRIEKQSEE